MTPTRYRVLVVEDQPIYLRGLRGQLEDAEDMDLVGECANAEEAIALAERERPDVVLLDFRIPLFAGGESEYCAPDVIRQITALVPETRLLVLSMHEEPERVQAAVEAGAAGYLCKDEVDVTPAVRAVAAGNKMVLDLRLARIVIAQRPQSSKGHLPFRLTRAEGTMLELMAKDLTNQQIAKALHLAPKTVANRAGEIQNKLDVDDRAAAVEKARKHGFGVED
ncbi:response regulator transcription factor [Umezawaea sp. Da 62-37]|uniref:response regulator transcription factor n=1 Tax=Umezawaea sp. Da 62-37 TaxID=3075927 RepID=UPI0028F71B39|nr:response regulator transcription factor [Umezawaea sp. Da 62-37]WNV83950.1 response regulator transcription factor [Umezawaea sp. Da 62-37]